jgi:glutamyl-tRNA reductase
MDDVLKQRLDAINTRLDEVERKVAGVDLVVVQARDQLREEMQENKNELREAVRNSEMRVTTEIHGVLGSLRDLKGWLQERDNTQAQLQATQVRLGQVEERLTKIEKGHKDAE